MDVHVPSAGAETTPRKAEKSSQSSQKPEPTAFPPPGLTQPYNFNTFQWTKGQPLPQSYPCHTRAAGWGTAFKAATARLLKLTGVSASRTASQRSITATNAQSESALSAIRLRDERSSSGIPTKGRERIHFGVSAQRLHVTLRLCKGSFLSSPILAKPYFAVTPAPKLHITNI